MDLKLGNLKLSYPDFGDNAMVSPLIDRLIGRRKAKARLRRSGGGGGRRYRDPEMADEMAVMKFINQLREQAYKKDQDRLSGRRTDRQFALDASKEERMRREAGAKQVKEHLARQKEFVFKWIELWNKAGSQDNTALQKSLARSFDQNYFGSLSPQMQKLVEPILRNGPFSPTAKKAEQFKLSNPAPRVTADPNTDPLAWAQQTTALYNWRADLTGVTTGTRPEVPPLIGINDGLYLSTKNGGQIMREEDLRIQKMADNANVPVQSLLTNGGFYGKQRTVRADGKVYTVANFTDLEGRTYPKTLGSKPDPLNKEMFQFMKEWATWPDLDKDAKEDLPNSLMPLIESELEAYEEKLIASGQLKARPGMTKKETARSLSWDYVSNKILKPRFGYNFILRDWREDTTSMLKPFFMESKGEQGTLSQVPGDLTTIEGARVYYDAESDSAFDSFTGDKIGTYQETEAIAKKQKAQRKELEESSLTTADKVFGAVATKVTDTAKEQDRLLEPYQQTGGDADFNSILEMIKAHPED